MLESLEGPRRLATYSFIGFDPTAVVRMKDGVFEVLNQTTGQIEAVETDDPLGFLRSIMRGRTSSVNDFRMTGGAVGYVSYDLVRHYERLPDTIETKGDYPELEMGIYDDGLILDHARRETYYFTLGESRLPELHEIISRNASFKPLRTDMSGPNIGRQNFESSVLRAKEYIASGDIFQVVLSKRYELETEGSLFGFYEALRRINPSPYMYFVKQGDRTVVGTSPEMLVRVEQRQIETYPIAGTRPITSDPQENLRLQRELLADPKERAEHVMLVDLARNDIGRVSRFGTVKVSDFMTVQRYGHVQHIVSRVSGQLADAYDAYDALRVVFPAGTVSGAPKIRAMEIIEELENVRRGPYAGAVGYFSFNGNADFAITIRTLVANGREAFIQTGAGIVADSVPANEWFETEQKAESLFAALGVSRGAAN